MEIPEKAQAEALSRVAALGKERAELLAQARALLPDLRKEAVEAVRIGAQRSRVQQLSRVSTGTLYGWLRDAGVEIRTEGAGDDAPP
ncbi:MULTISPECIES: hypothetical protein [Streptomyces]|uniref:hypothetical protein n=1 Tax=Streptomyces TaxID=1883 RepID=UPI00052689C3|nr:hypothetical protein [Streptomyces lydicus]MDC7341284.1 hypothetical protein [Streptomyces lydicus]